MPSACLRQVERNLTRLRQQLAGKKDTLTTTAPEEQLRIQQQIDNLKTNMQPFEREYWQILADKSATTAISEPAPEVVPSQLFQQCLPRLNLLL